MTGNGAQKLICIRHGATRIGAWSESRCVPVHQGQQSTGEVIYLQAIIPKCRTWPWGPDLPGIRKTGKRSCRCSGAWNQAKPWLSDPAIEVVLLDERTYMFKFEYLNKAEVFDAINIARRTST